MALLRVSPSLLLLLLLLSFLASTFPARAAQQPVRTLAESPTVSPDNTTDNVPPNQENWAWCVDNEDDYTICGEMVKILDAIDTDTDHSHTCVKAAGDDACMKMIQEGTALFSVFDGGEIWEAYSQYELVPLRTEYSDVDTSRYFGVGIVNADKCPNSLADLKGLRSCHTGYGRSAGWTLPISYLMQQKFMAIVTADSTKKHDIQSVEAFFSKSCAAHDDDDKICTACKTTVNCNEDDLYYDYAGSFRCVVEGSGDISFTKGVIPGMYAKGGTLEQSDWTNLKDATQYKIVCPANPDGNLCADVSTYKTCNFGSAPGHTIMVSKNLAQNELNEFNAVMNSANSNAAFVKLFSAANYSNSEFASGVSRSIPYNGTVQDLLGSLYSNIVYLDNINAATTNSSNAESASSGGTSMWAAPMNGLIVAALSLFALLML